ncbi:MAG TPA: 2-phospho-L-lactate transferase [Candidatus Limnocylindrales bacterium]|nr:2-phospho-L-lactate transferase [Candidatus Limnocylindrales bacterium]
MALEKIVALVGGVGGAKLAHGLAQILPPEQLTIIVNTGDDFWHHGLRICPDLDTVMYTLAGLVDPVNGWGVAGDTTAALDALAAYGDESWFRLGDRDIATHLLRTERLRQGERLTTITHDLSRRLHIGSRILPMTDAEVATIVHTRETGPLPFQEYFVKYRWQPAVTAIRFEGAEAASLSPEAVAALNHVDAILIAPSNPWLSVAPILAVPGLRARIESAQLPRVAITPIVGGRALKGPAAKLMAELGYTVTPESVAGYYGSVINGFVYDERDPVVDLPGLRVLRTDTIMTTDHDRARFAAQVLAWMEQTSL